jgi:hypothetical protein
MIILVTIKEKDEKSRTLHTIVSYGVDTKDDDRTVVLPNVHPSALGAKFDYDIGEYVIHEAAADSFNIG